MAYTPNNPLVPGDPYSYDLKWMVDEINKQRAPEKEAAAAAESAAEALAQANAAGNSASTALTSANNANASAQNAANSADSARAAANDAADYANSIGNEVGGIVADWLTDHITITPGVVIDTGLTTPGAAADAAATGDQIRACRDQEELNLFDALRFLPVSDVTQAGVSFHRDFYDNTLTLNGTATTQNDFVIYNQASAFPPGIVPGGKYYFDFQGDTTHYISVYAWISGTLTWVSTVDSPKYITIPNNATGFYYRFRYAAGTYNNTTYNMPKMLVGIRPSELMRVDGTYLPSCSLNDVLNSSCYLLISTETYTDKPASTGIGFLITLHPGNFVMQLFYSFTGGSVYKRRGSDDGSIWEAWNPIGGGGSTTINNYSVTNNITGNVSAASGAAYHLDSSGDNTDRSNDIAAMLAAYGYCKLGPGIFYIGSPIIMPIGSNIEGCGEETKILCTSGTAIQLNSHCSIDNLRITGSSSAITPDGNIDTHHAITWIGTYDQDQQAPDRGRISNIWIDNFTGAGIYAYNTGYATSCGMQIENLFIRNCNCAIDIAYWSEYHHIVNAHCTNNYYGCINNGGNNLFISCDFSSCQVGFVMDNSQSQSPNNSHGSAVGCVFNHTANNSGKGIIINNCNNGFIFSACQLFFSKTEIINSSGVVFNSCNYGFTNCNITVSGGGIVLFEGCIFQNTPPINVTSATKFINSYNRTTGNPIA